MNPQTKPSSTRINILDLEQSVYQQNVQAAGTLLLNILNYAEQTGGMTIVGGKNESDSEFLVEYTRLASAITAFFAHPNLILPFEGFQSLARLKKHLLTIFEASGFRGTEHLLALTGNQVGTENADNQFVIKGEQQLMKFLLFYSFDSAIDMDFTTLLKQASKYTIPVYFSLASEECLLSQVACEKRDKFLEFGPLLEDIALQEDWMLARLSNLWMDCSYSNSQTKHDIKKHLNIALQKWMINKGIKLPPLPTKRPKPERPTILVALERFTSIHAMFRSYAPSIKQLQAQFKLVLVATPNTIDAESQTLFEQVIEIKDSSEIKKLLDEVLALKPDMLYFPSLGMSDWTLLLANLRLAPIQWMTLGHPATSHSPFIDYCLMQEGIYSAEVDCFSEKVILMDNAAASQMIAPQGTVACLPDIRQHPSPLRIAITSSPLKLNAAFMAVCQQISQQSEKALEFHFFLNRHGIVFQKVKQRVYKWLPNAKLHPAADYNTYITNLNQCDIHLSPFPFGGTNSNIDSMKQGIPIVALEGHEPHARTDSLLLRLSNLPEWLRTHSQEEYIQAALRLITNDDERIAISEALLTLDFAKLFLDHEYHHHDKVFGKTVAWLYQFHETIQKEGKKVWTMESQQKLPYNTNN